MGKKKIAEQTKEETLKEQAAQDAAAAKSATRKGSKKRIVETGNVYVKSSYNNTVITVTDENGGVLAWATAGSIGFSGPKKATPFAASKIVSVISEKLRTIGMQNLNVVLKGVGGGRDSSVRSLMNQGFNVASIKDVTPIPHNGPRPKKVRRV